MPVIRRAAAWATCLATLAAGTAGGFQAVAVLVRPAFAARTGGGDTAVAGTGAVIGSVAVSDDVVIRQDFDAWRSGLAGLRLRTVTWGTVPDDYPCGWSLVELAADGRTRRTIRSGTLAPATARDWDYVDVRFAPITDSLAARYTLRITTVPGAPGKPLGLPLFAPEGPAIEPVVRRRGSGEPVAIPRPAALDVRLVYAGEGG